MLSEKTIKELVSTPAFLINASKLAYMLRISRQDASQELLLELLDHRLRKWTDKDVTLAIQRDLPSLKWKIKYSRKDLVRKEAKDATRELTKSQMLSGMEPQASNEAETLEALERLRELFKNANTRDWCGSILRFGQKETMVRFNNQTRRQFNNKLAKVCKYARQHRQHNQSSSNAKELELLKEYITLVDDAASDEQIGQWIYEHKESPSLNRIVDSSLVKFQGKVLKDFISSGVDRYTFNELMHARYIKLEQELDRRKIDE